MRLESILDKYQMESASNSFSPSDSLSPYESTMSLKDAMEYVLDTKVMVNHSAYRKLSHELKRISAKNITTGGNFSCFRDNLESLLAVSCYRLRKPLVNGEAEAEISSFIQLVLEFKTCNDSRGIELPLHQLLPLLAPLDQRPWAIRFKIFKCAFRNVITCSKHPIRFALNSEDAATILKFVLESLMHCNNERDVLFIEETLREIVSSVWSCDEAFSQDHTEVLNSKMSEVLFVLIDRYDKNNPLASRLGTILELIYVILNNYAKSNAQSIGIDMSTINEIESEVKALCHASAIIHCPDASIAWGKLLERSLGENSVHCCGSIRSKCDEFDDFIGISVSQLANFACYGIIKDSSISITAWPDAYRRFFTSELLYKLDRGKFTGKDQQQICILVKQKISQFSTEVLSSIPEKHNTPALRNTTSEGR